MVPLSVAATGMKVPLAVCLWLPSLGATGVRSAISVGVW
jgi:hypothetical protein